MRNLVPGKFNTFTVYITEVIRAVLNFLFFLLRKDFARTKSTKSTKSTKRHKDTQAKAENANKWKVTIFPLDVFKSIFYFCFVIPHLYYYYGCVYVFPSTVEASPDSNKTRDVMPEIRPTMLCWGNHFVSSTFIAIS